VCRVVTVAQLLYYPVKGCAGTSVTTTSLTAAGPAHDRTFMAVAPDGKFRSQRRHPVMATIRPTLLDGGSRLALRAPDVEDLVVDVLRDGPRHEASTFTWRGKGVHQGAAAADWFSTVLGEPSVLVGLAPEHERETRGLTPGTAAFADAHALLVTSLSSLDLLGERIAEGGGEPVPMDRFRPNIVVDGWPEPHTEDRVRRMTVGTAEIGYAEDCVRCTVPTVDQNSGRRAGHEPIRTLATYRRAPEGGVTFGMKAAVVVPGQIAVGDAVTVTSWASE
jgi:uncharacterized protein YcbX